MNKIIKILQELDESPYQVPDSYEPNFKNPQVIKRCKKAIGFVVSSVPVNKPKQFANSIISIYLGQSQTNLAKYLRRKLLICKKEYYSKDLGIAKEYIRNESGIEYLSAKILGKEYNKHSVNIFTIEASVESAHERYADILSDIVNGTVIYKRKSHRYYNDLQNVKKETKRYVLADIGFQHEYDIAACAPTLLYQYAQQLGMDEYMLSIGAYIEDRTAVREYIAKETGISVKDAKMVVNALFSGAKLGMIEKSAIYKHFNGDRKIINKLKNNTIIRGLRRDISLMWKHIAKYDPYISTHRSYGINKNGVRYRIGLTSPEKWNLYFILESSVIECVFEYNRSKDILLYTEHDGWSTRQEQNINEILDHIKAKTGFRLKVDYRFNNKLDHISSESSLHSDSVAPSVALSLSSLVKLPEVTSTGMGHLSYVYNDQLEPKIFTMEHLLL